MVTDKLLLIACKQSYKKHPKLKGYDCRKINIKNDSCTIYFNDDNIIISFAGTNDMLDVLEDIKFIKTKTKYGKVHKGFNDVYLDLEIYVQGVLHNLYSNKPKSIYITGHSLGGAVALLCSINFVYRNMVKKVVTFGCPRVGDRKWKTIYNKTTKFTTIRYVHGGDIITKIPKLFYYHVGEYKHIPRKTKTKNYWGFIRDFFVRKVNNIKDHDINNYIKDF